jgi:uncharacterized protein
MSQAEALYSLQEIDLGIHSRQKRLEEIAAQLADAKIVADAQQNVDSTKQILAPLQTKSRNLELEIQTNTSKIQTTDEALYSGRVSNPKELQEMQQEIVSLKKRNRELEDSLLETMLEIETAEAELLLRENALKQITIEHEAANQHLIEERKKIKIEGSVLVKNKEQMLPEITADSLKIYNSLKPRKSNQPVALLVNKSCTACRVEQDLAIVSEVRKAQKLVYCSSCGRILAYRGG